MTSFIKKLRNCNTYQISLSRLSAVFFSFLGSGKGVVGSLTVSILLKLSKLILLRFT